MSHQKVFIQLRISANAATPVPDSAWLEMPTDVRIQQVETAILEEKKMRDIFAVVDATADGQIIVCLLRPFSIDKRGTALLDLECFLKEKVNDFLTVWLEPLDDRNKLRKLRGMEIK